MGYLDETGLSRVWNRIKAYIQSLNYTSNIGTVTGITMNNTSYSPIDGDVDIGTVVTDVSGKANTADLATVATSGSYADLDDKPTIPTVPTNLSSFTDDLGSNPTHTHSQYLTSETEPDFNGSAAATLTSSNIVKGASQSYIIWSGTLLEYDAITTKDNNTIYFIKES